MKELQKAYLDGASMAYKDVARKIRDMIDKAPIEVRPLMACMEPMIDACNTKAKEVYNAVPKIGNN